MTCPETVRAGMSAAERDRLLTLWLDVLPEDGWQAGLERIGTALA